MWDTRGVDACDRGSRSIFEGFDAPRLGAVTESEEGTSLVPSIGGMRAWASIQEMEPNIGCSSVEVEAVTWVEQHPMHSPSPGWDADDIDASIAAFPKLL
jgi:hypothetical protein